MPELAVCPGLVFIVLKRVKNIESKLCCLIFVFTTSGYFLPEQ